MIGENHRSPWLLRDNLRQRREAPWGPTFCPALGWWVAALQGLLRGPMGRQRGCSAPQLFARMVVGIKVWQPLAPARYPAFHAESHTELVDVLGACGGWRSGKNTRVQIGDDSRLYFRHLFEMLAAYSSSPIRRKPARKRIKSHYGRGPIIFVLSVADQRM